jgi:hypothetical protein
MADTKICNECGGEYGHLTRCSRYRTLTLKPSSGAIADRISEPLGNLASPKPSVGETWKDKDPRSPNEVRVLELETDRVRIQRPSVKVWVSLKRFVRRFEKVLQPGTLP